MVVAGSLHMYKHLNFWMVTLGMKAWWLSTVSITPVVQAGIWVLNFLVLAIPCGAALKLSPEAALVSAISLLLFSLFSAYFMVYENWLWAAHHSKIQDHIHELKNSNAWASDSSGAREES